MMHKKKLVIFDLDGTLTRTKSGEPFKKDPQDWEWIPERAEKYSQVRDSGAITAIATNQAGPLWRETTIKIQYPSAEDVAQYIKLVCEQLLRREDGKYDLCFVSLYDQRAVDLMERPIDTLFDIQQRMSNVLAPFGCYIDFHPEWRKPKGGMLLACKDTYNLQLKDVLFVGDRPEDNGAALDAKIDFLWDKEFFA